MKYVCTLLTIYVVGAFVAVMVIRARAGVGVWHRLKVFGDDGFGLGWLMSASFAASFWPVTLLLWLARGRPEPRVVFNEKAAERHRRQGAL